MPRPILNVYPSPFSTLYPAHEFQLFNSFQVLYPLPLSFSSHLTDNIRLYDVLNIHVLSLLWKWREPQSS